MARVLIIEPDKILGEVYAQSLSDVGHKVRLCNQAQSSIYLIDEQVPDVVVLELQLADHSGIEFLYELRSYKEWQHIPIVIHSLVPDDLFSNNILQMRKLGVTHYLYKPNTNLVRLKRAVAEALESAEALELVEPLESVRALELVEPLESVEPLELIEPLELVEP